MDNILPHAQRLAEQLKLRRHTLAVSESSTGGLISATMLSTPGASAFFLGGAVVYTAASREGLLGIAPVAMTDIRSASEPYALLCARTIKQRLGADWAIAETGAAGPTGNRYGDQAGHSCLAITGLVEQVLTLETGDTDRIANMRTFAVAAIDLLYEALMTLPST
jgi:PncC family amidohydrolase